MRFFIEMGCYSLDVTVSPLDVADMDGRFRAVCNDTGETLYINGWLMDSCEPDEKTAVLLAEKEESYRRYLMAGPEGWAAYDRREASHLA